MKKRQNLIVWIVTLFILGGCSSDIQEDKDVMSEGSTINYPPSPAVTYTSRSVPAGEKGKAVGISRYDVMASSDGQMNVHLVEPSGEVTSADAQTSGVLLTQHSTGERMTLTRSDGRLKVFHRGESILEAVIAEDGTYYIEKLVEFDPSDPLRERLIHFLQTTTAFTDPLLEEVLFSVVTEFEETESYVVHEEDGLVTDSYPARTCSRFKRAACAFSNVCFFGMLYSGAASTGVGTGLTLFCAYGISKSCRSCLP